MSTFYSLNYHITFSTKERRRFILDGWSDRLHAYLGGTVASLGGKALKIGGTEDHIHLLVGLKTTHRVSDFMRELKKASSKWVHEAIPYPPFEWQDGYAVFSVSPSAISAVTSYIANQKEHHRSRSYRDELVWMLAEAKIDYDPKYLD